MTPSPSIFRPTRFQSLLRILLIGLAIAGCGVTGLLATRSLPSTTPESRHDMPLCTPSARVNCDYVLSSPWAKVGPFPVASLGFVYFAALAAWFLLVGIPNRRGRFWHLVPLLLATAGGCGSLWFVYVMAVHLPVWCTWCLAVHVVNALLWLAVVAAWPWLMRKVRVATGKAAGAAEATEPVYPSSVRAGVVLGGTASAVLMVLLASLVLTHQAAARLFQLKYLDATNNAAYIAWRHSESVRREIPIRPDDPSYGAAEAPFTLVVFSDFECANCAVFHHNVLRLVSQFPQRLRCVFKHFPVSARCNPHVGAGLHFFACEAARAAEAARACGSPKQTQQYYSLLHRVHSRFADQPYLGLARSIGIDADAFAAAMADAASDRRVREDIELGHRLGVEGTPALFLNGRRLSTWRIVTRDAHPRMDVDKTLRLWERLLGATARVHQKKTDATTRPGG